MKTSSVHNINLTLQMMRRVRLNNNHINVQMKYYSIRSTLPKSMVRLIFGKMCILRINKLVYRLELIRIITSKR